MANMKGFLRGLLIVFIMISMGSAIVNALAGLRDALINSGLLSGTITTTATHVITPQEITQNLSREGIRNDTTTRVVIKDMGDSYIVNIYKRKVRLMENRTIETWSLADTRIVPKTKQVTVTSTYDFSALVNILAAFVAISLLIIIPEKLGIKL